MVLPQIKFKSFALLGFCQNELTFNPDPEEVAGIIELPLLHFLDENNVVSQRMDTSYSKAIDVPAFKIQEHFVWGATAMMLSELKETLKKVL